MLNKKTSAMMGLLLLGLVGVFLSIEHAQRSSDSSDLQSISPASNRSQHPETRDRRLTRVADKDPMRIIRAQLELLLSDTPELASLDQTLAACKRLESTSSIMELLSDARFGWKRLSPTTLFDNSSSRTFNRFAYMVHEALFERWGELDLDGALEKLETMRIDRKGPDFDQGMSITFNLYKGAAGVGDGAHAFDRLIPPGSNGFSEHDSSALGYLIEGWARSDPDAAWQTLVTFPAMQNAGRTAIKRYFSGLAPNTDWPAMAQQVEAYCAAGEFIAGPSARGEFRRDLAASWIRHDPAAALDWFAHHSEDPLPNSDPRGAPGVMVHAAVIEDWLKGDMQHATQWLATWRSDTISVPEVLAMMYDWERTKHPHNKTPGLLEAVGQLLEQAN